MSVPEKCAAILAARPRTVIFVLALGLRLLAGYLFFGSVDVANSVAGSLTLDYRTLISDRSPTWEKSLPEAVEISRQPRDFSAIVSEGSGTKSLFQCDSTRSDIPLCCCGAAHELSHPTHPLRIEPNTTKRTRLREDLPEVRQ